MGAATGGGRGGATQICRLAEAARAAAGSGVLGGCWEAVWAHDVWCRLRRAQERAGRSPAGGGRRWEGVRLLCVCVAACGRRSQQCRGGSRAAAEGGGGRYVSNKVREAARCGAGWVVVVEQGLRRRSLWAGSLLGLGCSGCVSGRGRASATLSRPSNRARRRVWGRAGGLARWRAGGLRLLTPTRRPAIPGCAAWMRACGGWRPAVPPRCQLSRSNKAWQTVRGRARPGCCVAAAVEAVGVPFRSSRSTALAEHCTRDRRAGEHTACRRCETAPAVGRAAA